MSASREKKQRQVLKEQGIAPQQLAAQAAAKKRRKNRTVAAIVIVLVLAVAVTGVYFGLIQPNRAVKTSTALQVGDHALTPVDMSFYYMDTVYQFYNQYGSYLSYVLDTTKSLDAQYYDEDKNITWADHFQEEAAKNAATSYALYDDAVAQGMSLSDEQQTSLDTEIENLKSALSSNENFKSFDDYLAKTYGKGCDEDAYRQYRQVQLLASQFSSDYTDSLTYSDEEVNDTYQADPQKYTAVTYRSFYVSKSYFAQDMAEDATDEEKTAADEAALAQAEEKAKEMTEACKGDETAFAQWARDIVPETSQATYADDDATLTTESSYDNASSYGRDWLYADDRQAGDTAYFEADGNGYYVYYFIATSDNDYTTANVRQILVSVTNDTDSDGDGTNDTISDEAWQTAKDKADELLQQWRDGDATEDSFGELAKTSSADSATSTNGGLVENLSHNNFGDERDAWCYDTQRKVGDCEIVKTDSGYAILYYVGPGENRRANLIRTDLKNDAYTSWYEGYQSKYTYEFGSGMKYVNTDITLTSSQS